MNAIKMHVVLLSAALALSGTMIPSVAQDTNLLVSGGQMTSKSLLPLYEFSSVTNPATFGIVDRMAWSAKFLFNQAAFQYMVPIYTYSLEPLCKNINATTRITLARYGFLIVEPGDGQSLSLVWWTSPDAFCFIQEWNQFKKVYNGKGTDAVGTLLEHIKALRDQGIKFQVGKQDLLHKIEDTIKISNDNPISTISSLSELIQEFLQQQQAPVKSVVMDKNTITSILQSHDTNQFLASVSPIDGKDYTIKLWASCDVNRIRQHSPCYDRISN